MRPLVFVRMGLASLALLAVVAMPALTRAGGIEVTLDKPLPAFQAGVPAEVGFSIHSAHEGHDPITGLHPLLVLTSLDTKESATARAEAKGALGHYVASVTVPSAGRWRWEIQPWGKQDPSGFNLPGPLVVGKPGEAAPVAGGKALQDVKMLDSSFEPAMITIEAGTTIRWVNAGIMPHMVTAVDGSFASGNIAKGESYEFTFDTPGTYQYYCDYHAMRPVSAADGARPVAFQRAPAGGGGGGMIGKVVVTAAKVDAKAESAAVEQKQVAPASVAPAAQQPVASEGASALLLPAVGLGALLVGGLAGWLLGRRRPA